MARVTNIPFKFFRCPFCGELVQPVACGRLLGKMKCPVCRKKCYRQTFTSNCPMGSLRVEDDVFEGIGVIGGCISGVQSISIVA